MFMWGNICLNLNLNVFNSGLLMPGLGMDGFFFSPFSNKLIGRSFLQFFLLTQPYLSLCPWGIWPRVIKLGKRKLREREGLLPLS